MLKLHMIKISGVAVDNILGLPTNVSFYNRTNTKTKHEKVGSRLFK